MQLAAKLDEFGKPAWIALMVLGFIAWWPLGLAVLAFSIWSGRMGRGSKCAGFGPWGSRSDQSWGWGGRRSNPPSSGNLAFDEYREETLRRLEDEQRDFQGFLERLRLAKDKAEFDQFMDDRRSRPAPPPAQNDAQA